MGILNHRVIPWLLCCLLCSQHADAALDTSPPFTVDLAYPYTDSDNDGMQDAWELAHGLTVGVDDSGADPDQDGRSNIAEYNAGTDPAMADSGVGFGLSDGFSLGMPVAAVDGDGDGIPDTWELANGLNTASNDAALDPDGDGISNLAEYNGGWNPLVAEVPGSSQSASPFSLLDTGACPYGWGTDTDGDGMPDWWEIKYGLNRTVDDGTEDLDHDGVSNLAEYRLGLLPNHEDQGGMGLAVSLGFVLDTIVISLDTDGDGMPDWWEIAHGLNPGVDDAGGDPDYDGRTNLAEYNAGTDPKVDDWIGPSQFLSTAFVADTGGFHGGLADDSDHDGMPDWWETKYGLLPGVDDAAGNPDGDALANVEEYNAGSNPRAFDFLLLADGRGNIFTLDTAGYLLDSDGDGMPNWWEALYSGGSTNMSPGADSDTDGRSNLEEYISQCDPANPFSVFHVGVVNTPDPARPWEWVLTWDTARDRLYSVYSHTNLATQWPSVPVCQVEGDGAPKSYTNTDQSVQARFYRIAVEMLHRP